MPSFNITSFRGRALIKVDIRQMCVGLKSRVFGGEALIKVDRQMCVDLISRIFGVEH